jgi:hypothetical protein
LVVFPQRGYRIKPTHIHQKIGARKKKNIAWDIAKCDLAHKLTRRTYGEKKWWVVIVKVAKRFSRRDAVVGRPFVIGLVTNWPNPSDVFLCCSFSLPNSIATVVVAKLITNRPVTRPTQAFTLALQNRVQGSYSYACRG